MSFLAPLFLAGAAAVLLPIFFHLIRRSSREKVLFSSLMFLSPSPPTITKRSRLEHLLLLILRCTVVCLLALAFARPFLPASALTPPAGSAQSRVLILVDGSASMRRENLWEDAKRQALSALRNSTESAECAIYLFDRQLRSVLTFTETAQMSGQETLAAARARLDAISPGFLGTHLGHALPRAAELLLDEAIQQNDHSSTANRIVVVSDFASGSKLEGLQGFDWPKNLQVELRSVQANWKYNASLQILPDTQPVLFLSTNAPLRVRVQNHENSPGDRFKLVWKDQKGAENNPLDIYVPAGQSKIFTLSPPPGAQSLELSGDDLQFDNVVYYARPEVHFVHVAYFGNATPDDPQSELFFLKRALEQTNLTLRLETNLTPAVIPSLVIVGRGATAEQMKAARILLSSGKTLLVPLHAEGSSQLLHGLLPGSRFNLSEASVNDFSLLTTLNLEHPILAPFRDPRFSDFSKVRFWHYRKLELGPELKPEVLARFDSGDPALLQIPAEGGGEVLILTTSWAPRDSQLALSSKYVPLLFSILQQRVHVPAAKGQFLVGESVPLGFGVTGSEPLEVVVQRPNGENETLVAAVYQGTDLPGIYHAQADRKSVRFAVNLDPAESKLAPLSNQDLAALGVPLDRHDSVPPTVEKERQASLLATQLEGRQKLWRWCILIAVILLFLESIVAHRQSTRAA